MARSATSPLPTINTLFIAGLCVKIRAFAHTANFNMAFQITIQPSGHSFPIEPHETILEAAIRHGYILPYSCHDGVCGTCKGKVLQGRVDYGKHQDSALTELEKTAGMALFCCARPLSDLIIECREVNEIRDIPVKTLPCRVQRMQRPAPDVMVLSLQLPANERLQFMAGQYIDILLKDQKPRSFSLANAPHDDKFLELHIGMKRPMHFYWGARKLADLYMLDKTRQWESRGIKFTPVLSEALPEDAWQGRTGLVHRAVLDDYNDLAGHEVYACGAPVVVEAAQRDFTTLRNLPNEAFFSDAFTFA